MPTGYIVIDPENDFGLSTGPLYVPYGEKVVEEINNLRTALEGLGVTDVFVTRDWHPKDHISFYTQHPEMKPFEVKTLEDGSKQVMWPPHCVQGSTGADFLPGLVIKATDTIVLKGTVRTVDSYSGFASNDGVSEVTQLETLLKARGITHLVIVGLAFDYCVAYTALDAAKRGFITTIVRSATKGINAAECQKQEQMMTATQKITVVEDISSAMALVKQWNSSA